MVLRPRHRTLKRTAHAGTNTCAKSKKGETLLDVNNRQLFKIICILIFLEKVVVANANADPKKEIKKQRYLFDSNVQKFWDCLPKVAIDTKAVSQALVEMHNFASRRDAVCVRVLLNTCLVLINHIKDSLIYPSHVAYVLMMESAVFNILGEYDPEVKHAESIQIGYELAEEILNHLEHL